MIFFDANVIVDYFIKRYIDGKENHRHQRAIELVESIDETKVISNLVMVEVINVLYLKYGKNKDFIKKVYTILFNDFEIIDDSEYYDIGLKKLLEYNHRLSINDCIYLAIMEDYDIEKIVSFNPYFDNKGVNRVY